MKKHLKILKKKCIILGTLMIILNLIFLFNSNLYSSTIDLKSEEKIKIIEPPLEASVSDYDFYKKITISSSQVSGSESHSNFPVLISLIDSDLYDHCQVDGDDIAFYSGRTLLDFEIEYFKRDYTNTTAKLVAWVRIPSLSTTTDTIIRLYYGNPTLGNSEANPTSVWDSNYVGIWHLSEDPTGTIYDSTENGNDGVSSGSMTSGDQVDGQIDGCIDFDGTDDLITIENDASLDINNDITIEFWMRTSTNVNDDLIEKGTYQQSYSVWVQGDQDSASIFFNLNDYTDVLQTPIDSILINNWYHVVCMKEGTSRSIYINGDLSISDNMGVYINSIGADLTFSTPDFDSFDYEGQLDEIRISDSSRDGDWIKTEYRNQNNPNNFYTVGNIILVDDTPPTTEINYNPEYGSNYIIESTLFSLSADDGTGSGVASSQYKINSDIWTEYSGAFNLSGYSEGIHTIYFNSTDNEENVEEINWTIVYLDKEAPITTLNFISDYTTDYVNRSTYFNLTSDDYTLGSGISLIAYKVNNSAWNEYTGVFNLSNEYIGDGQYIIYYNSTDNVGNIEGFHNKTVYLYEETTAPHSYINFDVYKLPNHVNSSTYFSLNANDEIGGSGEARILYRIDTGNWNEYSDPFTLFGHNSGEHTIYFYSIDNSGNFEILNNVIVQYGSRTVIIYTPGDNDNFLIIILSIVIGIVVPSVIGTIMIIKKKKKSKKSSILEKNSKFKDARIKEPRVIAESIISMASQCMNNLMTNHGDKIGTWYYSNPKIYSDSYKCTDGLFLNENDFIQKRFIESSGGMELAREMNINPKKMSNIKAVQFIYTDDISERYILDKCENYQIDDTLLLIIGLRWPPYVYDRVFNLSGSVISQYQGIIKVISHDLFTEFINFNTTEMNLFNQIFEAMNNLNLDKLKELYDLNRAIYHETDDLIDDLKEKSLINEKIQEFFELISDRFVIDVYINIMCPICKVNKKIEIPNKVVIDSKQLSTINILKGTVCEHSFQAFVDKNFNVRGYQKVDFDYDLGKNSHIY